MPNLPDTISVDEIDALLPQTQCTQCDYPRCRDYAAAIASDEAAINQCPPGGDITIAALAALTGQAPIPLNTAHGEHEPRTVAVINEPACIGCKLCIKACPVDCIIGAGKMMHTVIDHECTGCKLCLPVCPTDCIDMISFTGTPEAEPRSRWPEFSQPQVEKARFRTAQKVTRLMQKEAEKQKHQSEKKRAALKKEIGEILARKRSH